jgi:hypothetical protein
MPAEMFISSFEESDEIYSFTSNNIHIKEKIQFDKNDIFIIKTALNTVFKNFSMNYPFLNADKEGFDKIFIHPLYDLMSKTKNEINNDQKTKILFLVYLTQFFDKI